MTRTADPLDVLVDRVTQQVAERLKVVGAQPSGDPGTDPDEPCDADHETCNACGFCNTRKAPIIEGLMQLGAARIAAGPGGKRPAERIAGIFDHTLLKPDVTQDQLRVVCDEARKWGFATVCVNAVNIPYVAKQLAGSDVKPIAVVGFPLMVRACEQAFSEVDIRYERVARSLGFSPLA